jgi:hypothetical protein
LDPGLQYKLQKAVKEIGEQYETYNKMAIAQGNSIKRRRSKNG